MKPARLRPQAKADLSDMGVYYAEQAGRELGDACVDAALAVFQVLEAQPGIGSLRWAAPDETPPLRAWRLGRFPALWFYFERDDHLDVVRLLGERPDIAAILAAGFD